MTCAYAAFETTREDSAIANPDDVTLGGTVIGSRSVTPAISHLTTAVMHPRDAVRSDANAGASRNAATRFFGGGIQRRWCV